MQNVQCAVEFNQNRRCRFFELAAPVSKRALLAATPGVVSFRARLRLGRLGSGECGAGANSGRARAGCSSAGPDCSNGSCKTSAGAGAAGSAAMCGGSTVALATAGSTGSGAGKSRCSYCSRTIRAWVTAHARATSTKNTTRNFESCARPVAQRLDDEPSAEPVRLAELDPPRSSRAPRPAPVRSRRGFSSRRALRCVCDSGVRTAGCCWSLSGLMSTVTVTQCEPSVLPSRRPPPPRRAT